MFAEKQLLKWWNERSEDQRAALKRAAETSRLDADATQLLTNTGCPVGPVGTRWDSDPDYAWSWPENVRTFVVER